MIEVTVDFHGPFRIAQGAADDGVDVTARADRVPASSLKGVMRAAADHRLALPETVVQRIFGTSQAASPWAWTDLVLDGQVLRTRTRVPLDPTTRTARKGGLLVAQEVWCRSSQSFRIEWCGDGNRRTSHDDLLLAGIALAVKSLGSARRRGLGWVSMRPALSGNLVDPAAAAAAITSARRGGSS